MDAQSMNYCCEVTELSQLTHKSETNIKSSQLISIQNITNFFMNNTNMSHIYKVPLENCIMSHIY